MARVRNLHRIDLYCPEYMTNATILIDQNHHSGQPHLVAHYEMGGLKGQMQFSAAIPAHWGDDDLIELIFLSLEKRENHNYPTWEVPTRDHGSATLFKFWNREKARSEICTRTCFHDRLVFNDFENNSRPAVSHNRAHRERWLRRPAVVAAAPSLSASPMILQITAWRLREVICCRFAAHALALGRFDTALCQRVR